MILIIPINLSRCLCPVVVPADQIVDDDGPFIPFMVKTLLCTIHRPPVVGHVLVSRMSYFCHLILCIYLAFLSPGSTRVQQQQHVG